MIKFFTKRMNNKKGFTLIELIVVIAILGILIAIAVPRLAGFTGSAVQRTVLADIKTMETAAIAVVSDSDSDDKTFESLKIAGEDEAAGDFEDFLDSDIIEKYGKVTFAEGITSFFNDDGRVNGFTVTINGIKYTYDPNDKSVTKAPETPSE